jgi:hypothetical protein
MWVGQRAVRVFDGERFGGMITASWTGEGEDSPSKWHDGDSEDLSLNETRAAVLRHGAQPASIFAVTVASTHGPTRRTR